MSAPMRRVEGWDVLVDGSAPLVRDVDLASRAGLSQTRDIRKVIQKNRSEIEEFGPVHCRAHRTRQSTGNGGERFFDVLEYWLNEDQAVALVALLRTPMARALRVSLVRLFGAMRRGELASAPVAFPIAEVHGSRIGETAARAELVSWCRIVSRTLGVTMQRVHGAVRRQYKVPSVYTLSVSVWPTAKAFLESLASGRLFLESRTPRPVLRLVRGGAQVAMPWGPA